MKRLWLFIRDILFYGETALWMLGCLLEGSDEVEITVHSDESTLKISFDPLAVIGETRMVEELTTRDEGSQYCVWFWREGKLYREKDNSAYMR